MVFTVLLGFFVSLVILLLMVLIVFMLFMVLIVLMVFMMLMVLIMLMVLMIFIMQMHMLVSLDLIMFMVLLVLLWQIETHLLFLIVSKCGLLCYIVEHNDWAGHLDLLLVLVYTLNVFEQLPEHLRSWCLLIPPGHHQLVRVHLLQSSEGVCCSVK